MGDNVPFRGNVTEVLRVCQNRMHNSGANTGVRREQAYSDCDPVLLFGEIFDEPALKKAKASVDKGRLFEKRKELWIQLHGPAAC